MLLVYEHTFGIHTTNKDSGILHVLDVREGKDGSAIKAVGVPAQYVVVGLLLLLFLFFPVQQLELQINFTPTTMKRSTPEKGFT